MRDDAYWSASAGLTLVELMVAMVLSLVLMAAVYLLYQVQSSSSNTQGYVSQMQQDLRLSLDVMEKDIRMAGLDPDNKSSFGIIEAGPHAITVSLDYNGDGLLRNTAGLEAGEYIRYALNGATLTRQDGASAATDLAQNVTTLGFVYYDKAGAVTAVPSAVRSVIVSLGFRSAKIDPDTGTYLDRSLARRIRCRNMGLRP